MFLCFLEKKEENSGGGPGHSVLCPLFLSSSAPPLPSKKKKKNLLEEDWVTSLILKAMCSRSEHNYPSHWQKITGKGGWTNTVHLEKKKKKKVSN